MHSLADNAGMLVKECDIPVWSPATGDDWKWLTRGEVGLPIGQVEDDVEIVPCEDTAHARAHCCRVDVLDVLIRISVNLESFLPFLA